MLTRGFANLPLGVTPWSTCRHRSGTFENALAEFAVPGSERQNVFQTFVSRNAKLEVGGHQLGKSHFVLQRLAMSLLLFFFFNTYIEDGGRRHRGRRRKWWMDNVKGCTSVPNVRTADDGLPQKSLEEDLITPHPHPGRPSGQGTEPS